MCFVGANQARACVRACLLSNALARLPQSSEYYHRPLITYSAAAQFGTFLIVDCSACVRARTCVSICFGLCVCAYVIFVYTSKRKRNRLCSAVDCVRSIMQDRTKNVHWLHGCIVKKKPSSKSVTHWHM